MKLVHLHSLALAAPIVGTCAFATRMNALQCGMAMMQLVLSRLPAKPAK